MKEIKLENYTGVSDFIIRGENTEETEQAVKAFEKALEYINHLPYNMTYTTQQVQNLRKEIEEKYNVEIALM
ncbi:MAG: hypothetical protein MJA31_04975 [Clostridia bacterium]|nr:hypothetical protein [Clostridia bacterium]